MEHCYSYIIGTLIKDIKNYYGNKTNSFNRKLIRRKIYGYIAETTEIISSSLENSDITNFSIYLSRLPCSVSTAFASETVCRSLSKTV